MEPGVGCWDISEGAEPIEAEDVVAAGKEGGAGGVARWAVGDGAREGVGESGRCGGGWEKGGEGGFGAGEGVDKKEGARVEGWVGGLESGEEGAEPAVDGDPAGGLAFVEEVEGGGASRVCGGWGSGVGNGVDGKGREGECGGGGGVGCGGGGFDDWWCGGAFGGVLGKQGWVERGGAGVVCGS